MAAGIGLVAEHLVHPVSLAIMPTMPSSIGLLRLFDLHRPSGLAIGILPFIIESPDYRYVLSVFPGTVVSL